MQVLFKAMILDEITKIVCVFRKDKKTNEEEQSLRGDREGTKCVRK